VSTHTLQQNGVKLKTFIKPMLASLYDKPFSHEDWIFEIKWDGYRAIADVSKKMVRLYSRNGLSFSTRYPTIVEALKKIRYPVVLDGEIVVVDKHNRPSFQKLQHYEDNKFLPLIYYVFDCLSLNGDNLMHLPLLERKKLAQSVLPESSVIRYCDHVKEHGDDFYRSIRSHNLEGMIAKRADSSYLPGKRTHDWLKIKNHNTEEAIIAGFTAPRRSRQYFGALVLGMYEEGRLRYVGHTGTGFTEKLLKELFTQLKPYIRRHSPFEEKVSVNAPVTWVDPVFVCAIKFTERTEDGIMRHPVFMGLRTDKSPEEVILDIHDEQTT
jgi:bifunctional non-homologous end joining protein LigD